MLIRKLIGLVLLLATVIVNAQQHFSFSPEKPKPGDVVTITYEPAGDIANTILPIDAYVHQLTSKGRKVDDITFQKKLNQYSTTITVDTGASFIYFSFSSDHKFDNNFNNGYFIQVYENGQPRKGSYFNQSQFYQYLGSFYCGMDKSNEKAVTAFENEFELYADQKKTLMPSYLRLLMQVDKEKAQILVQKEIEAEIKNGLKEEMGYNNIAAYYTMLRLPEQAKFFTNLKKEKFPKGNWTMDEKMQKFFAEKDPARSEEMLKEILNNISNDPNWSIYKDNSAYYQSITADVYAAAKNWDGFKSVSSQITDRNQLASLYNNRAWEMQKTGENLAYAEEISKFATDHAKSQWQSGSGNLPKYAMSEKQWKKNAGYTYGMYADTYAMIMYRMGKYKQGYPFAKDAAILINEGKSADENNTYALLAEKVLPAKQAKKEIEQFVKDGKSTAVMQEILKRIYVKEKKSDAGFDNYIAGLQQETYKSMLQELRKSMLNETVPSFALLDMSGNKTSISDLKGKVVVVDFWATWCGPCKASFPGMQKMVTKYKDNPDVKFVFIDTWERVDNKEKNAADFIANNKYTFHVLMDNESKVVDQFKVDGIPTKFVIDKNGVIRFKAVGFDGSDDKLISELTAMIDMASSQPKAF